MKTKAQSILEYVVVIGIVAAALSAMQFYAKRTIQAAVKVAADDMSRGMKSADGHDISGQKKGAQELDYQYEHKYKGDSKTLTSSKGQQTKTNLVGGAVTYGKEDTTTQTGAMSWGFSY